MYIVVSCVSFAFLRFNNRVCHFCPILFLSRKVRKLIFVFKLNFSIYIFRVIKNDINRTHSVT